MGSYYIPKDKKHEIILIKQIIIEDKFFNLKTDYFLQMVFNNLQRKKALEIAKYNKKN